MVEIENERDADAVTNQETGHNLAEFAELSKAIENLSQEEIIRRLKKLPPDVAKTVIDVLIGRGTIKERLIEKEINSPTN